MRVDAKQLWQAVKNATLFSKPKGFSGGATKFEADLQSLRLIVSTSDDFIGVSTSVDYENTEHGEFYLDHKALKDLEVALRTAEGNVELSVVGDELHVDPLAFSTKLVDCPNPEWWEMFEEIVVGGVNGTPTRETVWEVSPARLQKLSLLEPKGKYPLSVKNTEILGSSFVALRYGPDCIVVIKPLSRQALEDAFLEETGAVVW